MRRERRHPTPRAAPVALTLALGVFVATGCADAGAVGGEEATWHNIAGNHMGQRYSPLDQINADNFENLELAWVWDGSEFPSVNARATPIYVDGKLIRGRWREATRLCDRCGDG